jgi:hypothetical protein
MIDFHPITFDLVQNLHNFRQVLQITDKKSMGIYVSVVCIQNFMGPINHKIIAFNF